MIQSFSKCNAQIASISYQGSSLGCKFLGSDAVLENQVLGRLSSGTANMFLRHEYLQLVLSVSEKPLAAVTGAKDLDLACRETRIKKPVCLARRLEGMEQQCGVIFGMNEWDESR